MRFIDKFYNTIVVFRNSCSFLFQPVIVQLAANKAEIFREAVRIIAKYSDGIDLNLGCPQHIARKGQYGAFLMNESWEDIYDILKSATDLAPIMAKIRIFESVEKTVQYAKKLESAGIVGLTVHGRRIDQKKDKTGIASWKHI